MRRGGVDDAGVDGRTAQPHQHKPGKRKDLRTGQQQGGNANAQLASFYEAFYDREAAIRRAVELGFEGEGPALVCLLAKGDETRQHVGDEFVPCRTDGEVFLEAAEKYAQ